MISIIVAMSSDRAIGCNNALPWHIPEDLKHFKQITMGHTIIMGRKTFESLPHGALPGRRNVVLSRTIKSIDGAEVYTSLDKAVASCKKDGEIFIIGGASVYAKALPITDKLYITLIDNNPNKADAFFPEININKWVETKKEKHEGFSFYEFCKK